MDMDATINGIPVTEENVKQMFLDICEINIEDEVTFSFKKIDKIREGDEYTGYRVSLTGNYPPMAVPLKLDITTGDKITPKEISYEFKLLLEDRSIKVLAYNLETVLAEKLETIISRGDQNTRPRDFYDVFVLHNLQGQNIDYCMLRSAIDATANKRNSVNIVKNYEVIIQVVQDNDTMKKHWQVYQKEFNYAKDISFRDTCDAVKDIMDKLFK
jgi:hypothetical protein